jgi:hypothetical protein
MAAVKRVHAIVGPGGPKPLDSAANVFSFSATRRRARVFTMAFWDFTRNPGSVRLMVEFGREQGLALQALLADSGLLPAQLDDHTVELNSQQELQVIRNLLGLMPGRGHLGLEIGLRYRLSTFGMWGYGILSSATGADAMALAMRFQQLTFTFTQFAYREEDGAGVLVEAPTLDAAVSEFLGNATAAGAVMHGCWAAFALSALRSRRPTPVGRRPWFLVPRCTTGRPATPCVLTPACCSRTCPKPTPSRRPCACICAPN